MSLPSTYFVVGQFHEPTSLEDAEAVFKSSVTNVVVEITSHCNRHCTYCPVSQVDRSSENKLLPDGIFDMLLRDLSAIDYDKSVCLNLYNEPTSDRNVLLRRIGQLRAAVPRCRIYFSTNGDYLSREYLKAMVDAGLSELYVTLHVPAGKTYDDSYVIGRFTELSARLQKRIAMSAVVPGTTVQGTMKLFGITLNIFSTNYELYGSDRAGSMSDLSARAPARSAPCDRPFHDFTISYDGTLFPCCQMFVDNPLHKKRYSVGNLGAYANVFEAYASQKLAGWRKSMLRFGPKESPCDTCSEANYEGNVEQRTERDSIYQRLVGPLPVTKPVAGDLPILTQMPVRKTLLRRMQGLWR